MAAIILPQPWTRQPGYFSGINGGHPLARGLVVAQTSLPGLFEARRGQLSTGGSVTTGAGQYGYETNFLRGSSSKIVTNVSGSWSQSLSVFALVKHTDLNGGSDECYASCRTAGNAGWTFYSTAASGTAPNRTHKLSFVHQGVGAYTIATGVSGDDGVYTTVGATDVISSSVRFFQRGKFVESIATGAMSSPGTQAVEIGTQGPNGSFLFFNGSVVLAYVWDGRALTDEEHASLNANPWQLFAPLPRRIFIKPSAGGATTYTKTATLDAAIQEAKTATATLDAAIQQSNTATATLDGVVATNNTATATLDAAIQAATTAAVTLDAAIQAAMSATSTLDAVIQNPGVVTNTATVTLDAAIREAKTLTATLDAAIQIANTSTVTLDAHIVSANTATATLDATILQAVTAYALLDAYIFDADAPVVEVATGQTPAGRPSKDKKKDMRRRYVMPDDTIILATPTEAEQLVKLFVKPKPVKTSKAPKRVVKELKAVDLVEMEPVYSDTVPTEKITVKKKAVWDVEADLYVKAMRMMAERELKRRRHEEELILLSA